MPTQPPPPDSDVFSALKRRAADAKSWLLDAAFPLWWEAGFDRNAGCFHERLTPGGAPVRLPRRIRVQARQTYAYAAAGALGWAGPWREAVAAGAAVLRERGMRKDGGVIHTLDDAGRPADLRRDLYDIAFVAFALVHAGRALDESSCVDAAAALLDWTFAAWSHPAGGLREGDVVRSPPRRQNPHMHMLEALLALHEASPAPQTSARARALMTLAESRFVDARTGALREYFDDAWRPLPGDEGSIVEPGHQFEWAWLIDRCRRAGAADAPLSVASRLHAFAEAHGQNAAGYTVEEIWLDGAVRTPRARLWPHAERLKANIVRVETERDPAAARASAQAFDAMMSYCDAQTRGLWREHRSVDGVFEQADVPASSLYHLVLAFSELIRVADTL